nr:hypothetical protein [Euzebyales bacterium]
EDKRAEAEQRNRRYRETKDLRRHLERVEAELVTAEARVADLTRTLADPAVYDDAEQVKQVVATHNVAKDRAAELFAEWERLSTRLEAAEARAGV